MKGRVTANHIDENGKFTMIGLEGAELTLVLQDFAYCERVKGITDADGMFLMEDIPTILHNYPILAWLRISHKDYRDIVLSVTLGGFPFYRIINLGNIPIGEFSNSEGAPEMVIHGKVVDASNNLGLNNVQVELYSGFNVNEN